MKPTKNPTASSLISHCKAFIQQGGLHAEEQDDRIRRRSRIANDAAQWTIHIRAEGNEVNAAYSQAESEK